MPKKLSLIITLLTLICLGCADDNSQVEWEAVQSGTDAHLFGVHFIDAKKGWAVGSSATVLSSKDGGKTWIQSMDESLNNDTLTEVSFATPTNGWLVSIGKVHYTGSGGNSWSVQHQARALTDKPPGILDLYFVDTAEGWAVGGTGTILHTLNGGSKWETRNSPSEKHLWGVHFVDSKHGWIVGEDGEILHTSDGGKRWDRQNSNAEQPLFAVYFINQKTGWIVGSNGLILHTTNGGQTWHQQNNPMKQSLRSVAFRNEKQGWAIGEEGLILHTIDSGTTWNQSTSPTTKNLQEIMLLKKSGWIVGEKGTILRMD